MKGEIFLQSKRCYWGEALDPALLRRAGPLTWMGGGSPEDGRSLFRPAYIIGNDIKMLQKISVFAFFIHLTFFLAAKTFLNADIVLSFLYLLAPMLSIFTDVIFKTGNIYELFRNSYFLIAKLLNP